MEESTVEWLYSMFSVMKRAIEPEHSLQSLNSHCNVSSLALARQRHTLRRYKKSLKLTLKRPVNKMVLLSIFAITFQGIIM